MRLHPAAFSIVVLLVSSILFILQPALAGEVVTDDLRQWARQSIQDEGRQSFRQAANTVAVIYFQNRTGQPDLDPLQKGLAVMLITDLAKIQEIQVVERAQLQALLDELQLATSELVAGDTAPRVGRLLGTRYLVGGDFEAVSPDRIVIGADLLEIPRSTLLGSPSSSGVLDDLIRMEKELVFEIVRLLQIELTPEEVTELRKPISMNIRALMLYFQGIHSSDQGAYEEAAGFYREALQVDPGLRPAREALKQLEILRLISPRPGSEAVLRNLHKRLSVNEGPVQGPITRREYSDTISVQGPGGSVDVEIQWR